MALKNTFVISFIRHLFDVTVLKAVECSADGMDGTNALMFVDSTISSLDIPPS